MDAFKEYERRLRMVREAMRERGLSALLFYDSGRQNFLRMNYVAYLTDFISIGPHALLVVPLDEEPSLFLSPSWEVPRAKEQSWVKDIRPLAEWRRFTKKNCGTVGLAGREMIHAGFHEEIVGSLNQEPANAKEMLEGIARRKSPFELERIKRAAAIADAGVQELHEGARPGLREFELAALVEYRMRSLGAEDNFGMVVASGHNQALHPPTDRLVESGDVIISEITPCVEGYFVQICRTMILGEASALLREKFELLKRAMEIGLETAKPGNTPGKIAATINRTLSDAGYEKFCRPPYMRVRGHGLGGGSPAPGNVEDSNLMPLEEGMTFIIHPNQYLPETGYLTLGDTVMITGEGAAPVTRSAWDLYVKG